MSVYRHGSRLVEVHRNRVIRVHGPGSAAALHPKLPKRFREEVRQITSAAMSTVAPSTKEESHGPDG
jgi:hypothetical protein